MAETCIFCQIGIGEIESDILYRDDNCLVIRDISPKAPVHLLVIPHRHFTYLTDLTAEDYPMIGGMFKAAQEMAEREGVAGAGYRLIINQGSDAGQAVDHLHLHVLGGSPLGGMG
jgi:histidine triad (HIT) family protein